MLFCQHLTLLCDMKFKKLSCQSLFWAAPPSVRSFSVSSSFTFDLFCSLSDMLFLQGSEVIFKVALSLLGSHKPLILQQDSLESIVDFIKTMLPNLGLVQMEKTINQVRKEPQLLSNV